jgi:hypothetical protein
VEEEEGKRRDSVCAGEDGMGGGGVPERHVGQILVEPGSIKVRAKFFSEEIADMVALCAMAIAHAEHGGVLRPGPHDVRVLVLFFSVLGFVARLRGGREGR